MALTEHLKLNADAEMRVRLEDRERARIDEILIRNATRKEALAEGKAEGKAEVQKEVAQKLADKGPSSKRSNARLRNLKKKSPAAAETTRVSINRLLTAFCRLVKISPIAVMQPPPKN